MAPGTLLPMEMLIVDCATCTARGLSCGDCVITALLGLPDEVSPPRLDDEEQRVLGLFADSGLLPPLRLVTPVSCAQSQSDEEIPERFVI